jgi:putative tryptophan/tyrosine transport system substrate-binding protein
MLHKVRGCLRDFAPFEEECLMERRLFLGALGALVLPSLSASAQNAKSRQLIAVLYSTSQADNAFLQSELERNIHGLGYRENQIEFAHRFANGDVKRMPALAREIILLEPDVIVTGSVPATIAVKNATAKIPIVCASLGEPVSLGLVASYAHPGGNITGVASILEGMASKRLQLVREILPNAVRAGILVNTDNAAHAFQVRETRTAASEMKIDIITAEVSRPDQIEEAFKSLEQQEAQIVIVLLDQMFLQERKRIATLAEAARLPTIAAWRDHADVGSLMSYGVNLRESYRQAAGYVDLILKGTKPSDLPIDFPAKQDLVINLKTAKALGLTIPPSLIVRASDVIE